jgi:hypothetical protein
MTLYQIPTRFPSIQCKENAVRFVFIREQTTLKICKNHSIAILTYPPVCVSFTLILAAWLQI